LSDLGANFDLGGKIDDFGRKIDFEEMFDSVMMFDLEAKFDLEVKSDDLAMNSGSSGMSALAGGMFANNRRGNIVPRRPR
jgi:hypothetical protein